MSESAEGEDVDMNLEPLIDVTFQLLIFFLLAINFRTQEGQIASHLPTDQGRQSTSAQTVDEFRLIMEYDEEAQETTVFLKGQDDPLSTWGNWASEDTGNQISESERDRIGTRAREVYDSINQQSQEVSPVKIEPGTNVPSGRVILALDILNEYIIQQYQGVALQWAGNVHSTTSESQ